MHGVRVSFSFPTEFFFFLLPLRSRGACACSRNTVFSTNSSLYIYVHVSVCSHADIHQKDRCANTGWTDGGKEMPIDVTVRTVLAKEAVRRNSRKGECLYGLFPQTEEKERERERDSFSFLPSFLSVSDTSFFALQTFTVQRSLIPTQHITKTKVYIYIQLEREIAIDTVAGVQL